MHETETTGRRRLSALCAVTLLVLLAACGPNPADTTPTMSVQAIYTSAYQTLMAQQATELALTPPTSTPLPPTDTPTATLPPLPIATFPLASATLGGGGASGCDNSAFVADVTIPDNTTIEAGKTFTKTWTLFNKGTCDWTTAYSLVFSSGDQMGGASAPLKAAVRSGSQADISVTLTAPTVNGTYKGVWRMQNASGQQFGDFPYVQIKVGSGTAPTAGPSPTAGSGTVTISGSVNVVDFTITISSASSMPTVTYTSSGYSFTVNTNWTGTITPSKGNPGHWVFTPASRTFTNVTSNQTQDFTAVPVTPTPK